MHLSRSTMTRAAALYLAVAACLQASAALALDVTFQVRMATQVQAGNFDPAVDSVDLAGSFNGWGGTLTPLADADGDSTYVVTLGGFNAGDYLEYKFRINGQWDGTEEFPGVGNNRTYTVVDGANLIDVWYNEREAGGGATEPQVPELHWWNDAVFYQVFVRSFQDSDGNGIGDFPGLTQRLDYLNDGDPDTDDDLGVTALWLMPINASPSYHGYDVTDYRSIEPDYGTMADFQAFLAAAHARGIKVIIDFVMNHSSSDNPWFVASRNNQAGWRNWYRWSASNPGETGPWGQTVWHRQGTPSYYYGLFTSGMPDLNYDTPAVKAEMFDVATYWLDTIGVDGFRLDAVLYIDEDPGALQNTPGTLQFWQDFNTHVESVAPDAMTVGEAWTSTTAAAPYSAAGRLDLCFEFDLAGAVLGAVNSGDAGWLSGKLAQVCGDAYRYPQWGTFLTNHDQDRVYSVVGQDPGRMRAAAGLLLTLPGVPFVYYGEELGMTGTGDHRNIRAPMQWTNGANAGFSTAAPWQPLGTGWQQDNVALQDADAGSLLNWYRRLVDLRQGAPALRRGTCAVLGSSAAPVLAFVRADSTASPAQSLLCVANTSSIARGAVALTAPAWALAPGQYRGTDLLDAADVRTFTVDADGRIANLGFAGHAVRVFALEPVSAAPVAPPAAPRTGLRLEQNRPNPFNPSTTFAYELDEPGRVRIAVYDARGRELAVLLDEERGAGGGKAEWNGHDAGGRAVGAGVYFVRARAGALERMVKATLVK